MTLAPEITALRLAETTEHLARLVHVFERQGQRHPGLLVPEAAQALSNLIRVSEQLIAAAEAFEAQAELQQQEAGQ